VKCIGHISTSLGSKEVLIQEDALTVDELFDRLESMAKGSGEPGFNKFNTLVVVNEGVAFSAARSGKVLTDGQEIVLVPFSHGG
jgi:molybdopterin converting factor small subunit